MMAEETLYQDNIPNPTEIYMDRFIEGCAVITGAATGIGSDLVLSFVEHGINVVGIDQSHEALRLLRNEMDEDCQNCYLELECDVTKENDVCATLNYIVQRYGKIDILINSAAYQIDMMEEALNSAADLNHIINTNQVGPVICSRFAIKHMVNEGRGVILLINQFNVNPGGTNGDISEPSEMYPGAINIQRCVASLLRCNGIYHGKTIQVSNISLGAYCVPDYYSTLTDQDLRVLYISDVVSVVWYIMYKSPYVQLKDILLLPKQDMPAPPAPPPTTS